MGHNVPGKDEAVARDVPGSGVLVVANYHQPHVGENSDRAAESLCKYKYLLKIPSEMEVALLTLLALFTLLTLFTRLTCGHGGWGG